MMLVVVSGSTFDIIFQSVLCAHLGGQKYLYEFTRPSQMELVSQIEKALVWLRNIVYGFRGCNWNIY